MMKKLFSFFKKRNLLDDLRERDDSKNRYNEIINKYKDCVEEIRKELHLNIGRITTPRILKKKKPLNSLERAEKVLEELDFLTLSLEKETEEKVLDLPEITVEWLERGTFGLESLRDEILIQYRNNKEKESIAKIIKEKENEQK